MLVAIALFASAVFSSPANSAFNEQINYQGKLTGTNNVPVADADYKMVFELYSAAENGTLLWTEDRSSSNLVPVNNGLFSVMLGSVTSLPDDIWNQSLYLQVSIGTSTSSPEVLLPRKVLGAVPAAFEASNAQALGGKTESQFATLGENETVTGSWSFVNIVSITANSASPALNILQSGAGAGLIIGNGTASTTILAGNVTTTNFDATGAYFLNGSNVSQYFIDSAGTSNYVWMSDGDGRGNWVPTSSLGIVAGEGNMPSGSAGQTIFYDGVEGWSATSSLMVASNGTVSVSKRLNIGDSMLESSIGVNSILLTGDGRDVFVETASGDSSEGLIMRGNGGGSDDGIIRNISSSGYTAGWQTGLHIFTTSIDEYNDPDPILFDINHSEIMRITAGGRIGIGTTTPLFPLTVVGDINATGTYRINGVDLGQYFIDSAGTSGTLWMSDGVGRGYWASTSSLGISGGSLPSGTAGQTLVSSGGTSWTATSTLSIDSNGDVLVNDKILRVTAPGNDMISSASGDVGILLSYDGDGAFYEASANAGAAGMIVHSGATDSGIIHQDSAGGYAAGWLRGLHVFSNSNIYGDPEPIMFDIDTTEVMRIGANGNVGIGTTNPQHKLTVNDNGTVDSNGYVLGVHADDSGPFVAGFFNDTYSTTNPVFEYYGTNGGIFTMGTHDLKPINFAIGGFGNTKMQIAETGDVRVGTNMIIGDSYLGRAPVQKLDLLINPTNSDQPTGISPSNPDPHTALFISGTGVSVDQKLGIQFGVYDRYGFGGLYGLMTNSAGNTIGDLTFDMRAVGTDALLTERMRLTSAGYLGIGTSTPAYHLSVVGDINASGTYRMNGFDVGQYFVDSAGTAGQYWKSDGSGSGVWGDVVGLPSGSAGQILVSAGGSSWTPTSSMFVTANGDVGVGTISPRADLHVVGSATTGSLMIAPQESNSGDNSEILLAEDYDGTYGMQIMYDGALNQMRVFGKNGDTYNGPHLVINRDNGYLGIGDPSPDSILDVESATGPVAQFIRNDASVLTGEALATIVLGANEGAGDLAASAIKAFAKGAFDANNSPSNLEFYTSSTLALTISETGQVLVKDGNEMAPTYSFLGDPDTGMYLAGSNDLRFSTMGDDVMTINSSGFVGIGTTTPEKLFEVSIDAGGGTNPIIAIRNADETMLDAAYVGELAFMGNDGGSQVGAYIRAIVDDDGGSGWATDFAPTKLLFGTSNGAYNQIGLIIDKVGNLLANNNLHVDNDLSVGGSFSFAGNFGVGTTTPAEDIEIVNSAGAGVLRITRSDTAIYDTNPLGAIQFYGTDGAQVGASIEAVSAGTWTSGNAPAELNFFTSSTQRLSLRENGTIYLLGKVGIGQTSVAATNGLDVGSAATPMSVTVPYGGLCVDNDGSCSPSTSGRVSAVSYTTGNSDLAENYTSTDSLEVGDLVAVQSGQNIRKYDLADGKPVLGVVSENPAIILGLDNDSPLPNQYPIALSGRVDVKVTNENGKINIGDKLTPSNIPGVAVKAIGEVETIGIALEEYDSPDVGVVLTFVNIGWNNTLYQGITLDTNGNAVKVGSASDPYDLVVNGNSSFVSTTALSSSFGTANIGSLSVSGDAYFANIAAGTWNGDIVDVIRGGTGTSSFFAGGLVFGDGARLNQNNNLLWNVVSSSLIISGNIIADGFEIDNIGKVIRIGDIAEPYDLEISNNVHFTNSQSTNTVAFATTSVFEGGVGNFSDARAFIFNAINFSSTSSNSYILSLRSNDESVFSVKANGDVHALGTMYATKFKVGTPNKIGDLAENYPISKTCQSEGNCPEVGDIVCRNENPSSTFYIEKCSSVFSDGIVGAVSTDPSFVLEGAADAETTRPVALAGRILINVDFSRSAVRIGDYLTSSEIPGVAMKAAEPGRVIGMALESKDSCSNFSSSTKCQVMVLINPHWYAGQISKDGYVTMTTSDGKTTILDAFTSRIKITLEKMGLFIDSGLVGVKQIFSEKVIANDAEFQTIQLKDRKTGDTYCTWMEDGVLKNIKGDCADMTIIAPDIPTIEEQPLTTSTPPSVPSEAEEPLLVPTSTLDLSASQDVVPPLANLPTIEAVIETSQSELPLVVESPSILSELPLPSESGLETP